ncbi:MAG: hypothetical protein ACKVZJ_11190 [Phycisphaerales bacterium]
MRSRVRADRRQAWRWVVIGAYAVVFVPLALWAFQRVPVGLPCLAWPVMSFLVVYIVGWTCNWAEDRYPDRACQNCGYDLRGLTAGLSGLKGPRPCPECGAQVGDDYDLPRNIQ